MLQSGIHGWGLIARTEMKQDSMVVEYRGDLLRPKMSEDRQKYYNRIGKDCYLFNVNDDIIIDATMTGAVGRFTVSTCKACCVPAAVCGCLTHHCCCSRQSKLCEAAVAFEKGLRLLAGTMGASTDSQKQPNVLWHAACWKIVPPI